MYFNIDIREPCVFCHEEWKISMQPCYICVNKHICCSKCADKYIKGNYKKCFCSVETNIIVFPENFFLLYSNHINIKKYYFNSIADLYLEEISKTNIMKNPIGKKYIESICEKGFLDYENLKKKILKNSRKSNIYLRFIDMYKFINDVTRSEKDNDIRILFNILTLDLGNKYADQDGNTLCHILIKHKDFNEIKQDFVKIITRDMMYKQNKKGITAESLYTVKTKEIIHINKN